MKKIKYYIPALIWMIFIFIMSHKSGQDSSMQSNTIVDIIVNFINLDKETLSFMIRKASHMLEFAALLLFIYYAIKNTITYKYKLSISLLLTFLYACSDELHQLFIPGRSGQFSDVLIDTSGALIMILIIIAYKKYLYIKGGN